MRGERNGRCFLDFCLSNWIDGVVGLEGRWGVLFGCVKFAMFLDLRDVEEVEDVNLEFGYV